MVAKKDFEIENKEVGTRNLFVRAILQISSLRHFPRSLSLLISTTTLTPHAQVIKAAQSLTSRGYLKTQFSWQWYYYTLTPEGLDYLREWLHLPAEIVPATHIKQQRSHVPPRGLMGEDRPRGRGGRSEREGGYRRRDMGDATQKEGDAPGGFAPQFRGGFGRGRGRGGE